MNIKQTIPYILAKKFYSYIEHLPADLHRGLYKNKIKRVLTEISLSNGASLDNLSIISTNCFAGRIMQDLHLKYNSPTAGLYFFYPDYIEFLNNLNYYLSEAKLRFIEASKYELGNQRIKASKKKYPVALLGDKVEIHFLHYDSPEEAAEKWYRRSSRVNFNNLLIIGMQQNSCMPEDIEKFDRLSFKHKIMFSGKNMNYPSNIYMKEYNNSEEVGNPYSDAPRFYKYLLKHYRKSK